MQLGERLRQLRRPLTLKDVAALTGLSVSYLSDIERGRTEPTLRTLVKLAKLHRITVGVLLMPVRLEGELPLTS